MVIALQLPTRRARQPAEALQPPPASPCSATHLLQRSAQLLHPLPQLLILLLVVVAHSLHITATRARYEVQRTAC